MRPFETLGEAATPDGRSLKLHRRDGDFFLYLDGEELMSSRAPGSEIALAELTLAKLDRAKTKRGPRVLIGGLGLGYTLRAVLELLPADGEVLVAELLAEVVGWNRRELTALGRPLEDRRVRVVIADVAEILETAESGSYDAVLLDVDNGPSAWCVDDNGRLYGRVGLERIREALAAAGVLGVWSAYRDARFVGRMRRAGFEAREIPVRAREGRGARHVVFVGRRSRRGPARRGGRPRGRVAD